MIPDASLNQSKENQNQALTPGTASQPLVSVCIQTYQHAAFIGECLESILDQKTRFRFEIILGEDESTDGTREICIDYAKRFPTIIRLFLRKRKDVIYINGQPTGRFNFLENLKAAKGKYIALCEGDDFWTDELKLQKQASFLETNPSFSGIFHETRVINEMDSTKHRIYGQSAPDICTTEDTFSALSLFHTSSFLFRKSACHIPDWYVNVVSADMALFSIVSRNGPLKKIPEIMSAYRKHSKGVTANPKIKNTFHQKRIELLKYLNEFHDYKHDKKAADVIDKHLRAIAKPRKLTVTQTFYTVLIHSRKFGSMLKNLFS